MQVDDDDTIKMYDWMGKLRLNANEVLVYAIIHQVNIGGRPWYDRGEEYLAEWCDCSVDEVHQILLNLENKGLIVKNQQTNGGDNGVYSCVKN